VVVAVSGEDVVGSNTMVHLWMITSMIRDGEDVEVVLASLVAVAGDMVLEEVVEIGVTRVDTVAGEVVQEEAEEDTVAMHTTRGHAVRVDLVVATRIMDVVTTRDRGLTRHHVRTRTQAVDGTSPTTSVVVEPAVVVEVVVDISRTGAAEVALRGARTFSLMIRILELVLVQITRPARTPATTRVRTTSQPVKLAATARPPVTARTRHRCRDMGSSRRTQQLATEHRRVRQKPIARLATSSRHRAMVRDTRRHMARRRMGKQHLGTARRPPIRQLLHTRRLHMVGTRSQVAASTTRQRITRRLSSQQQSISSRGGE
jgi:hypothetical protein